MDHNQEQKGGTTEIARHPIVDYHPMPRYEVQKGESRGEHLHYETKFKGGFAPGIVG